MADGKHHIGDFLPPRELEKFMETFKVIKKFEIIGSRKKNCKKNKND